MRQATDRRASPALALGGRPERADRGRRRHRQGAVTGPQSEYSLWWREPEEQILPTER